MNSEVDKVKQIFNAMLEPGSDCTWKNPPQPMEIEELIEMTFQAGCSSTIAKIREGMPKKYEIQYKTASEYDEKLEIQVALRNQMLDLMEKNINDVENEI